MRVITSAVGVLVVTVMPVLAATPAHAADNVICVNLSGAECDTTAGSIAAALSTAHANGLADTVLLGPGTYSQGPLMLNGNAEGLTLQGSGQENTVLTMPENAASQAYLSADDATVRHLTVRMQSSGSLGDIGIQAFDAAIVEGVTINGIGNPQGTSTSDATGVLLADAELRDSFIQMPFGEGSRGVVSDGGGNTITSSILRADMSVTHSGPGVVTISQAYLYAHEIGAVLDSGTMNVSNTFIELDGNGTGLSAANFNASSSSKTLNADHVTIAGGGPTSQGVLAYAANPNTVQSSVVTLTNSIIWGPTKSLVTHADNNGVHGSPSVARIEVSHTDYDTETTSTTLGTHGDGGVEPGGGNLDVDPMFVDGANSNVRLAPGSPVIDKGNPAAGGPSVDFLGAPRVVDGDGDGTAVRDMGAFEFAPESALPDTTITKKPAKRTTASTVRFRFVSSVPDSTFRCRLDGGLWRKCTSPWERKVGFGGHTFAVKAKDTTGNVDLTPATYRFRRIR